MKSVKIELKKTAGHDDAAITREILNALKSKLEIPLEKIDVKVKDGSITLEGELQWDFQKQAVENSIGRFPMKVYNNIRIKFESPAEIDKEHIEFAFRHNKLLYNQDITVEVRCNKATLKGRVQSASQKDEAERIAWDAHNIWSVNNELIVGYAD